MLRAKNIWVAGGDPRQAALAALLADDGHSVHTFALEQGEGMNCEPSMAGADRADCVVLPLPAVGADGGLNAPLSAQRHELEEVLDALRPSQLVCAGMVGEELGRMAAERKLRLRDYFAREELAVLNAIPMASAVWRLMGRQVLTPRNPVYIMLYLEERGCFYARFRASGKQP